MKQLWCTIVAMAVAHETHLNSGEPFRVHTLECGAEIPQDFASYGMNLPAQGLGSGIAEQDPHNSHRDLTLSGFDARKGWSAQHLSQSFLRDDLDEMVRMSPVKAVLKAPIHTCAIKQYPAVAAFMRQFPSIPGVRVAAFSQPPNINFYDEEDLLLEQFTLGIDATASDIANLLASRGFRAEVAASHNSPLFNLELRRA